MSAPESSIAIVIPVFRDTERLERALLAIERSIDTAGGGSMVTIIVVDNEPSNCVAEVCSRFARVVCVEEQSIGSYAARNRGLKLARDIGADIIAFTDSDCVPDTRWVTVGANHLAGQSRAAIAGPIRPFLEEAHHDSAAATFDRLTAFPVEDYVHRLAFAPTANLWATADAFTLVGWFDERLLSGGDKEWCNRLVAAGGTIAFCENLTVAHPVRSSLKSVVTKSRRIIGGHFARAREDGLLATIGFVIARARPSVRLWRRILTSPNASLFAKAQAGLVLLIVDALTTAEVLALAFGKPPLR